MDSRDERSEKQMDKAQLQSCIDKVDAWTHTWNLYFFKIDRRSRNPYTANKVRFKNQNYLSSYAQALIKAVGSYQMKKVDEVRDYTGENSKVACDRLDLKGELVGHCWDIFEDALVNSSSEKISGKYNGYALVATPRTEEYTAMTMVKMANPVIELSDKRSSFFRFNASDELDMMSESFCRLYMDVDMIIIGGCVYAFNLKVETFFNLEKTMQKIKDRAISRLGTCGAFSDVEQFYQYARSYSSPRTFLTFHKERAMKLSDRNGRKQVAALLKLKLDGKDRLCFDKKEDASLLIKYICFKIFKDDETKGLLEATNVNKVIR